jgi:hypothetical protein
MNTMDFEASKIYIEHNYTIIEFDEGHKKSKGINAYHFKNPFWKVINNENEEFILMYCEKNALCKLCHLSFQKILDYERENNIKITWVLSANGYITGSNKLSMHQVIMNCYGNGKGTKNISVDHIDRDKLNNCYNNLRLATFQIQHGNCKGILPNTKRERKHNAKDLPEGITQNMMKKYVVYYHEWLDKEHKKQREYFKVEKHPKLDKCWITTKSNKVSIQDKLNQANKIVDDLEHNIYPNKEETQLPKYISLTSCREKPHLIFEKRVDGKRLNIKMVLPDEYSLQEELEKLYEKIEEKYNLKIENL